MREEPGGRPPLPPPAHPPPPTAAARVGSPGRGARRTGAGAARPADRPAATTSSLSPGISSGTRRWSSGTRARLQ
eukprot:7975894-Pyramimonas_sp.AAC.1